MSIRKNKDQPNVAESEKEIAAEEFTFVESVLESDSAANETVEEVTDAPTELPEDSSETEAASAGDMDANQTIQPESKNRAASPALGFLKIALPLMFICVVVALMLAVINGLTEGRIRENTVREKQNAIRELYTDAEEIIVLSEDDPETEIYLIGADKTLLGACVALASLGFGGDIEMMVSILPDGSVGGVRIVSMAETPGVGTRVRNDAFLSAFDGCEAFVPAGNPDVISGATISSKAVIAGVDRALSVMIDFETAAAENGWMVVETEKDEVIDNTITENDDSIVFVDDDNTEDDESVSDDIDNSSTAQLPSAVISSSAKTVVVRTIPHVKTTPYLNSANRVLTVPPETVYVVETPETTETETETEPPVPETTEPIPDETGEDVVVTEPTPETDPVTDDGTDTEETTDSSAVTEETTGPTEDTTEEVAEDTTDNTAVPEETTVPDATDSEIPENINSPDTDVDPVLDIM